MSGGFHDLLFEISNENRYEILVSLRQKAKRITEINREINLTTPEARRHISRLSEVGLIQRDVEGYYHLTPYGNGILILLKEFEFMTKHRDYLQSHTIEKIPTRFIKEIGELNESKETENGLDFLLQTEKLFKESNEYVWLLVDQFPLNSLSTIIDAIERGVKFKIIEPIDRIHSPNIDSMASEKIQALSRARNTPLVEQRTLETVDVNIFISERRMVLAFPTTDGEYDYKGLTASDVASLEWCNKLFQQYWDISEKSKYAAPDKHLHDHESSKDQIIVEGRNDPNYDTQAIQDAVDNYDEVILRGRFNLGISSVRAIHTGSTCVKIRRSVNIRGEGREDNIPNTKIVKSNWKFPFLQFEYLFEVDGKDVDVTIENIHFQDFNGSCITASRGNSVKIMNNCITLSTGIGRGQTFGDMGDRVTGITVWTPGTRSGGFPGGAVIEGNYLDFALTYELGGFIPRKKVSDPNYRPDHKDHETYTGTGILVNNMLGKVVIRDNDIRNMNAKGIVVQDNFESSEIHITGNSIVSEIYGSYAYSIHYAGYGIQCLSAWSNPRSGSSIEISDNEVRCDKLNYCGIAIYGMSMYREGAGKLGECIVRDNDIHLEDGHVGVLIRKNDRTEVYGNRISGKAYYGFHLWGSEDREGFDLGSNENVIEDNDLSDLEIKTPDEYSDSHVDGRMFTGSEGKSATSHVWLNKYSARNTIRIKADEMVIDEGTSNSIAHDD
jgi:predicted transcriptional regulator